MTARTVLNKTSSDVTSKYFLFYFDEDQKYSIAERKFIVCNDDDLIIGDRLKVRDNTKIYIGTLLNIGQRHVLEKILEVQTNVGKTPVTRKRLQNHKIDDNSEEDSSQNDSDIEPPKKKKRLQFNEEQSGDEVDLIQEEEEKEKSMLHQRVKTLETRLSEVYKSVKVLSKKVQHLETREVQNTPKSESKLETKIRTPDQPTSRYPVPVKDEVEEKVILHNDVNLMTINAPPKEPNKCAIKLLDHLFTRDELANGVLISSKKSKKAPLDSERVTKMFDVLKAKYTEERIQKMYQLIVDGCNQKCRDAARKLLKQSMANTNTN